MKFIEVPRALIAPILVGAALTIATVLPQAKAHLEARGSYPPMVCPGVLDGGMVKISLPVKGLHFRVVSGKNANLKTQRSNVILGSSAPTFISGNSGSEVAFESISGTSTADTACEVGGVDQWFIGGSAGITSKSLLDIVNSGLSDSSVEIFPFNSESALAPLAVIIKANSDKVIPLSSIVPGAESVAFHVVTDSGRVTSFLLDHRRSGLKDVGSSFVTPVNAPATTSFIPGLFASTTKTSSMMRFLVPGNIDANIHLTIYSNDGFFTPIGFDSRTIPHQRVIDLPIPTIALSEPFGIEVSSDQPILAATFTRTSLLGGDYSWANQSAPISRFRINLAGASAQFFFIGNSISLKAQWTDSKGKGQSTVISGNTSALWSPQGALNGILFTPLSERPIYGGAVVTNSGGGFNYVPLLSNPLISNTPPLSADLRTLTRR